MKQHLALREFSDDHYQGLVNALRLKRTASGAGVTLVESAWAFLKFWREDTSRHFRKEEEVLLPVLARHRGEAIDRETVVKMLLQHAQIRGLTMRLGDETEREDIQSEALWELDELLEAHIRLEERVVFPIIEGAISETALGEIASRLAAFEVAPPGEHLGPDRIPHASQEDSRDEASGRN